VGDKIDSSCNSTSGPSQTKLLQCAAVKSYDDAMLYLLEIILADTTTEFDDSSNTKQQ
jgi:hypothetical protein